MPAPEWLTFFQRSFPSANMALIHGSDPILIDTGYGSDADATEDLLREAGVPPETLSLVINTHYHSDHTGGNYRLQRRYDRPIAAHAWDAGVVNRRDSEAGCAVWLDQPIEPYLVTMELQDGDVIETERVRLEVLHTPGHTLGHIALYAPADGVLIAGDALHGDDVAWLNPFREGAGAIERAMESLERLASLPLHWACSGHGAPMENPPAAIAAALARYQKWRHEPEKLGWHACKRIFAYALMIHGDLAEDAIAPYLTGCGWFQDFARSIFGVAPADFVMPLVQEMLRSGAAGWQNGHFVALTPFTPPLPTWLAKTVRPSTWATYTSLEN